VGLRKWHDKNLVRTIYQATSVQQNRKKEKTKIRAENTTYFLVDTNVLALGEVREWLALIPLSTLLQK
jgi:hypothetical protein